MALIKCSECGKEISDKATTCPTCGCPTKFASEKAEIKSESTKEIFSLLGIAAVIGFAVYQGLKPPCLASAKARLLYPDSMKVESWDKKTKKLVLSGESQYGIRSRINFVCEDDFASER